MNTIQVVTSNNTIWHKEHILLDIAIAMTQHDEIVIDLLSEGPCCAELGLYDILLECADKTNYDLTRLTIHTANKLEYNPSFQIIYHPPIHLQMHAINEVNDNIVAKTITHHFGSFIGRSNGARLMLNAYLNYYHEEKAIQSYRYDCIDSYYMEHIGIEEIINNYRMLDVDIELAFLKKCPLLLDNHTSVVHDATSDLNLSQQLNIDNKITGYYDNFLIELVCETYYSGNTFFPTEKIWRPMLLKTPFVVQGPQNYLLNLQKLGFRTFSDWWDEGYDEDHEYGKMGSIKQNISWIANHPLNTLEKWYEEMQEVLEHNCALVKQLTPSAFYNG